MESHTSEHDGQLVLYLDLDLTREQVGFVEEGGSVDGDVVRTQVIDRGKESQGLAMVVQKRLPEAIALTRQLGNALGLPVVDGSCDAVVSVFAPVDPDQFARVISREGIAVIAIPGANHLNAVRALLYETPRPHDEVLPLQLDHRFALIDVDRVSSAITLPDQQVLRDLLTMTPYRFAVPPDVIARAVEADTPLTTTIEFVVGVFRPL